MWFGAAAMLALLAGVAFACTSWVGSFTLAGDHADSETVRSDGQGTRSDFTMTQQLNQQVGAVSETDGAVTFATGTSNNNSTLPGEGETDHENGNFNEHDGVYDVLYYNNDNTLNEPGYTGSAADGDREWNVDCMDDGTLAEGTKIAEIRVSGGDADDSSNEPKGEIKGIKSTTGAVVNASFDSGAAPNEVTFDLADDVLTETNTFGVDESAFCLSDEGFYYGNQVPMTVL